MSPRTVIVGASVGGVRTAQGLRAAGYTGEVVLVGAEPHLPYDKPPLSKSFLTAEDAAAGQDAVTLLTEQAAGDAGIRLLLGRAAVRLDPVARHVELTGGGQSGGELLPYDDIVIATGARARPSPWGEPAGVHVLRTLDDAVALRADLRRGGPLVVVGAGFVGAEVAATARGMGIDDVTVVDPVPVPMSRVLNPAVAEVFGRLHEQRGVATRFGVGVSGIDSMGIDSMGIDSTPGASAPRLTVRLADGSALPADVVVVGIGAVPDVGWLESSGLQVDDGVVCDRYSRAVGATGVHAVGDVARWFHPRHGALVRVEHWTNAVEQAACVAHNITHPGDLRVHAPVEYVWSDQYDWKVQMAGRTGGELAHVTVGGADPERSFAVLYAGADGGLAGAVAVNWPRALLTCRRALATGASLDEVRAGIAPALARPARAGAR